MVISIVLCKCSGNVLLDRKNIATYKNHNNNSNKQELFHHFLL